MTSPDNQPSLPTDPLADRLTALNLGIHNALADIDEGIEQVELHRVELGVTLIKLGSSKLTALLEEQT